MTALKDKLAVANTGDGGGQTIAQLIKAQEHEIARALPATGITPARFTRIVLTEIRKNPRLAECDPRSLLGSMMVAAQLGLEVGGHLGQAYLVPYKRECTLILGYKGILTLARRSGTIQSIVARAVHERDEFHYEYGLDEKLKHQPALGERGPAIAYYGVAKFKDGGHLIHVMSKADIEARRKRSKAADSGPWVTDYDAMACKTIVRAMAPYLPLTSEEQRGIALDETTGPATFDFDLDDLANGDPDPEVSTDEPEVEDAVLVDGNGEPVQATLDGEAG